MLTESTHRNSNINMHSTTTKQHHIIEKRSGKNWLVDKMCFACAEKSSFQDTTYTEHAVELMVAV